MAKAQVLVDSAGEVAQLAVAEEGELVVADPLGLANEWEECARALLGKGLPFADPWEDQPSLAVALRRLES